MILKQLKTEWSHYRAAYTGLPGQAWLLALVVFINRSGSMVLFFLSLYYTERLGFTVLQAGQLISMYGIGSIGGAYLGGWLSDRVGCWKVQYWSLILTGSGFILIERLHSFISLAICMLLLAIIAEAFRPANIIAFSQICPPEIRARGYALNRLAVNLGVGVGPAVGGLLAALDYAYLFWVDGITCIISAFFFWKLFKAPSQTAPPPVANRERSLSPWRDHIFLHSMLIMMGMGLIFFQIFNTWPLYLKNIYGLYERDIGFLLAVNALLIVLIEMPLVHRMERRPVMPVLSVGLIFLHLGFAILPLGNDKRWAVLSVVLWTMGEILVFPLFMAFVTARAPDDRRGQYIGILTLTFSLAFVAGPAAGSWIYAHYSPDAVWYTIGVMGFISIWCMRALAARVRKEEIVQMKSNRMV